MNNRISFFHAILFILLLMSTTSSFAQYPVKQFDVNNDVGSVLHPGSVVYDEELQQYTVSGSGAISGAVMMSSILYGKSWEVISICRLTVL